MTGDFILIIIITFGFIDDPQTIQFSFSKESQSECMIDAEKIEQNLPFISIETKCEPTLAFPPNENGESISTQWDVFHNDYRIMTTCREPTQKHICGEDFCRGSENEVKLNLSPINDNDFVKCPEQLSRFCFLNVFINRTIVFKDF